MWPVYVIVGVAIVVLVALLTSKLFKKKQRNSRDVEIIKDIRYTQTSATSNVDLNGEEEAKISYNKGDILIPVKVEKKVGKNADILPGKYTILTTDEKRTQINIKIGGYVRVYNHNSEIILAEGDTIMPVSIGIVLR